MRFPLAICAIAAVLLGASACSSEPEPAPRTSVTPSSTPTTEAPGTQGPRYVALGDSYTAGPGIAESVPASGVCARSTNNYPNLLAKALGAASFADVSCSGATTDNVLGSAPIKDLSPTPIPAQLDAVKPDTQLVTLGIGGNDGGLFANLSQACAQRGDACSAYLGQQLPDVLGDTGQKVVRTIEAIRAKAPKAKVVLVGYLGVTASGTQCDVLGGAQLDADGIARGEVGIDKMMAAAAKTAGATYVSMHGRSRGHDACAGAKAWTNGIVPQASGDGIALHPRAIGMKAVAADVQAAIKDA